MPETPSSIVPSWLLKAKVTAPAAGIGQVPRPALQQRLDALLECRFAALQAPAGFGKTTVLADFSRSKRALGMVVAWIALDDDDTPGVFCGYLAYAFECAGLDLSVLSDSDAWSSSPATYQVGMLARAVELHEAPCLLVLDEVDRLPRETLELLQRLLEHSPGNLHFALAFRANPGLDLAMPVLDGLGIVLDVEKFRFSRAEIGRFFGGKLSRRQLTAVEERTAGWPFALKVYLNEQPGQPGWGGVETARLTSDFIRARLLRGLSKEDRTFVCELAVFDWIDPDLVDEVLGSTGAGVRIAALRPLDGLLAPIGPEDTVRRLHPLARDHCADLLAWEDPQRKRSLHAGIARALARRGRFLSAWRHARSSGDGRLLGEFVEGTGVFDLWLRHGAARLFSADEFLTPEISAPYPRLELLRSAVLRMAMKAQQATALYESVARTTGDFARDREGGDTGLLAVDRVFTQVVLAGGSHQALHDEVDRVLADTGLSPGDERGRLILGARSLVLCGSSYERAHFDDCRQHAAAARLHFGEEKRYGNIVLDLYLGMAAMAQGRFGEAATCYARAGRETRAHFSTDPLLPLWLDAVTIELDLERNREKAVKPRTLKGLSGLRAVWTEFDAAAIAASAELTLERADSQSVTRLLVKAREDARAMRSEALSRHVSGLLVFHLAESGQSGQAARVWRKDALPEEAAELLDLRRQPWRTMESVACARIRLLAAQGEFAAAEVLASSLCATASEHELVRTRLRGLVLSIAVTEAAGWKDRSLERLAELLRLAREADYIRPLERFGDLCRVVLGRLLETGPDADMRDAAEWMLGRLDEQKQDTPIFSAKEMRVLAEVRQGRRNREIAGLLGISEPGVRFHLANIYRKTGVSQRHEAVRTAQSLGVLD